MALRKISAGFRRLSTIAADAAGIGHAQRFGAIAQLGERYNGIVEVVGSIPSGSTIHSHQ